MSKVIGMLVALAMFCAMPAVAFAQDNNRGSGNTNNANIDQGAAGGDASGGNGGNGGIGGDAGNQGAIVQQNAGDDARANINQSQRFEGDTLVRGGGVGGGDVDGRGHVHGGGVGGGHVHGGGVGGGEVQSVTLARTGFDAWVLALIGGISLAGGLGLLAAQRRGRLSA